MSKNQSKGSPKQDDNKRLVKESSDQSGDHNGKKGRQSSKGGAVLKDINDANKKESK